MDLAVNKLSAKNNQVSYKFDITPIIKVLRL